MTDTYNNEIGNQGFSCRRVGMVARYYYPALKTQIITFPLISLLAGVSAVFSDTVWQFSMLDGLLNTAIAFMFIFAPIMFARNSSRELELTLPATYLEKAAFVLLYTLICIPLLSYGPMYLMKWLLLIVFNLSSSANEVEETLKNLMDDSYGLEMFTNAVPLITCLFVVMYCKKSRTGKGILWSILSNVALGMVGLCFGIFMAYTTPGLAGENEIFMNPVFADAFRDVMMVTGVISLVYIVVMSWLTALIFKERQI